MYSGHAFGCGSNHGKGWWVSNYHTNVIHVCSGCLSHNTAMGRIFNAATQIRYHSYSLDAVCNDMTLLDKVVPLSEKEPSSAADKKAFESETFYTPFSEKLIIFDKAIELKDVYYQYPHAKKPCP